MSENIRTEQDRLITQLEALVAGMADHIVRMEEMQEECFKRVNDLTLLTTKLQRRLDRLSKTQAKLDKLQRELESPQDC